MQRISRQTMISNDTIEKGNPILLTINIKKGTVASEMTSENTIRSTQSIELSNNAKVQL